ALIGMVALRGVAWWAMAAPVLIAHVSGRVSEARSTRSWVHFAFLAALALLLAVSIPIDRGVVPSSGAPSVLTHAPEDLVRAARAAVPSGGRVFASEVYGSWVEFSAPDLPVFVDPRIEIFPQDVWDDYFTVEAGREGWAQTLDRWNVRVLVLHPYWAAGLLSVIDRDPAWHLVLRNDDGAVYARS